MYNHTIPCPHYKNKVAMKDCRPGCPKLFTCNRDTLHAQDLDTKDLMTSVLGRMGFNDKDIALYHLSRNPTLTYLSECHNLTPPFLFDESLLFKRRDEQYELMGLLQKPINYKYAGQQGPKCYKGRCLYEEMVEREEKFLAMCPDEYKGPAYEAIKATYIPIIPPIEVDAPPPISPTVTVRPPTQGIGDAPASLKVNLIIRDLPQSLVIILKGKNNKLMTQLKTYSFLKFNPVLFYLDNVTKNKGSILTIEGIIDVQNQDDLLEKITNVAHDIRSIVYSPIDVSFIITKDYIRLMYETEYKTRMGSTSMNQTTDPKLQRYLLAVLERDLSVLASPLVRRMNNTNEFV